MSMVNRRKRKASTKENKKSSIKKKASSLINMDYVPESLKREGYDPTFGDEEIPPYLKCPTCKELFVDPAMYTCGHTLCKICIEQRHTSQCPICKQSCFTSPITNVILRELISEQYPKQQERRIVELKEMEGLRDKLLNYQRSTRFREIFEKFSQFLEASIYINYLTVIKGLKNLPTRPSITEDEAKFFLSSIFARTFEIGIIGEYIIDKRRGIENLISSFEKRKPKGDVTKWIPLILMCMSTHRTFTFDIYQRLAKLYRIDIGKELPFEEWRGKPAHWLKEIDLEISEYFVGQMDSDSDCDSEDEFSSYYSDSISDY